MTVHLVHVDDVSPQPWKNGGGRTRELFTWPNGGDWQLRVSVAELDADGPFSPWPGVERWFAVVEGAGVDLHFGDVVRRLLRRDAPVRFDGAEPPHARLIDGPTRDLNLMLRNATGGMQAAEDGLQWGTPAAQCGLFTSVAGIWACADGRRIALPARTLMWLEDTPRRPHAFKSRQSGTERPVGWWMHFTPKERG